VDGPSDDTVDGVVVSIFDRKVIIRDKDQDSWYTLCRAWVKNDPADQAASITAQGERMRPKSGLPSPPMNGAKRPKQQVTGDFTTREALIDPETIQDRRHLLAVHTEYGKTLHEWFRNSHAAWSQKYAARLRKLNVPVPTVAGTESTKHEMEIDEEVMESSGGSTSVVAGSVMSPPGHSGARLASESLGVLPTHTPAKSVNRVDEHGSDAVNALFSPGSAMGGSDGGSDLGELGSPSHLHTDTTPAAMRQRTPSSGDATQMAHVLMELQRSPRLGKGGTGQSEGDPA
jgi:hypothetical protein